MGKITASRQITEGVIWKQILIFFFPILLGTFFQQMYNTVDTIIVGRFVSTRALAAVGTTGPLVNMFSGFFTGLSSGATVILAQFYGANDPKGVDRTLHTGFSLSLILGLLVTAVGCGLGPTILTWMQTPEECLEMAGTYLRIYFAGSLASMVYNMEAGILRAMGDSRTPVYSLAAGMLLVVLLRQRDFPLRFGELCLDGKLLKRILLIGIPAGLQFVTFDLSNTLIQSGINSFGSVVMAAWTAYGKTDAFVWMISGAFGVAITTFVGQNFGAQRYDRVRQSVRVCLVMSVGTVGVITLLMLLFRRAILGIYSADTGVIESGAYIMSVIVPFEAVFMPVEIFAGTFRGVGDSVKPTVITCLCVCVVRVVWLMTAVKLHHTLFMLCVCYPMTWILTATVFAAVYLKGDWLRKRIPEEGL